MSKRRQKAKPKLKTLNEISAAEAVKLFDGEGFPKNVAAKDYFEAALLYRRLRSLDGHFKTGQRAEITLTEKDLDELFFRAPQQRKIVDIIRRNKPRTMSLAEIAFELGGVNQSTRTVQNLLTRIFEKTKSKDLRELTEKLPPLPPLA